MGEFEDHEGFERDAEDALPSKHALPPEGAPAPEGAPPPDAAAELTEWSVRARRVLDEKYLLEEVEEGSLEAGRVLALHRTLRTRASLYVHHLRQLATFFREDPEVRGALEDADMTALKVAAGLRCTYFQAWAKVRDAHAAVEWMPSTFTYLRRGDLPEDWHHYLLRRVRQLTEEQAREVDAHMAAVELPSISQDTYERQVRLAVKLATAGDLPTPPVMARDVEIVDINTEKGTASLLVTGPILEIKALAHRLDVASRTVQKAQRAALEAGEEGPLPFDIDRDLAERGAAMSLRTLRYAILTHSILDLDTVEETLKRPGFRSESQQGESEHAQEVQSRAA